MAPCTKCGAATREYWLGGVVLLRECTVCGHTIVIADETNVLNDRNKKLHRRAQQAEASYAWARNAVPYDRAWTWNTAMVNQLRYEVMLAKARADAAEARLELVLAMKED
jgi:hypothetical protein